MITIGKTTKKSRVQAMCDMPVNSKNITVSTDVIPLAEEAEFYGQLAREAAAIPTANVAPTPTPAIDIDAPDNSDVIASESATIRNNSERVQVDNQGRPMAYDTRTDTWFPININLPGGGAPAPAAPAVDEKEKRKQLIMIFAGLLILLLIILFLMKNKK